MKTKKFNTLFSRHSPNVSWWTLWVRILETFTTAFLFKTIIGTCVFFKYFIVLSLKTKKISKKWNPSNCLTLQDQKKNVEKRKRNTKNEKNSISSNKHFFILIFLFRKDFILSGKIFGKPLFILFHLYYSFIEWQFIGNAVIKH